MDELTLRFESFASFLIHFNCFIAHHHTHHHYIKGFISTYPVVGNSYTVQLGLVGGYLQPQPRR